MLRDFVVSSALLGMALLLGACGGPGGPLIDPNSGQIAGQISIEGPFDPAVQLSTGLRYHQTGTVVDQSEVPVGKIPGAASAYFSGRSIRYSYSQLFIGLYLVEIYGGSGAARKLLYTSLPVNAGTNGQVGVFNGGFSFTGPGPYGSAAGSVTLTGTWPTDRTVFLGFTRIGPDETVLRWPVEDADVVGGVLPYSVGGLAFGDYELSLYSEDNLGNLTEHGGMVTPVQPRLADPDLTGQDFSALFP